MNDTGSFPDELDKTPMCFVKCYLESVGVVGPEDKIETQKALEMYQLENADLVEECVGEISEYCSVIDDVIVTGASIMHTAAAAVSDSCEKAYFFARCIMTRSLLKTLGEDKDN